MISYVIRTSGRQSWAAIFKLIFPALFSRHFFWIDIHEIRWQGCITWWPLRPPHQVLISFTCIVRFPLVDWYWLLLSNQNWSTRGNLTMSVKLIRTWRGGLNKPRLIGKLWLQRYRQLHVLSLDWKKNPMECTHTFRKLSHIIYEPSHA